MNHSLIKFTRGVPPPESFPNLALVECTAAAIAEFGPVIQQYNPSRGFLPLRQMIAAEHQTQPERVLLGQGSLQLLDLAARVRLWLVPLLPPAEARQRLEEARSIAHESGRQGLLEEARQLEEKLG